MKRKMFSPQETKVLNILGKSKKTITEISDELFGDDEFGPPMNPNNSVVSAISQINKKCVYHKLGWCIMGHNSGRMGKTVWRSKS